MFKDIKKLFQSRKVHVIIVESVGIDDWGDCGGNIKEMFERKFEVGRTGPMWEHRIQKVAQKTLI